MWWSPVLLHVSYVKVWGVALTASNWSNRAYNLRRRLPRCRTSTARILGLQISLTTQSPFNISNQFSLISRFLLPESCHCAYWRFGSREIHAHLNSLLDSETIHLHWYFGSTSLQTVYKLCNHSLLVAVCVELCPKLVQVCLKAYQY